MDNGNPPFPEFSTEKKTVFVLGAGASHPFRFPLGNGLREKLVSLLDRGVIGNAMRSEGFDVDGLRSHLSQTSAPTIDAFLEWRPSLRGPVTDLIVRVISKAEESSSAVMFPGGPADHWYSHLYSLLAFEDPIALRDIAVITFNYDRSLEYFLRRRLEVDGNERHLTLAKERLAKFQVLHPHGTLGDIEKVPYASSTEPSFRRVAANNLKIVADDLGEHAELKEAADLVSHAEQIVITGFGFDSRTMDRLFKDFTHTQGQIWATIYQLNSEREEEVRERFPENAFLFENHVDSLKMMKSFLKLGRD